MKTQDLLKNLIVLFLLFACIVAKGQQFFIVNESQDGSGNPVYTFSVDEAFLLSQYPLDNSDAFYSYFWSFGDGRYSFEENPSHSYSKNDIVKVMMIATPRYSATLPPPAIFSSEVVKGGNPNYTDPSPILSLDREPRPEHTSLAIINYKNVSNNYLSGAVLRLYFREDYFNYKETMAFNNETLLGIEPADDLWPKYSAHLEFNVGTLAPGETHTLFVNLETTIEAFGNIGEDLPELFLKAELICPNGYCITTDAHGTPTNDGDEVIQSFEILSFAVGSWDPNSKIVSKHELFYDEMLSSGSAYYGAFQNNTAPAMGIDSSEVLQYRINFQNLGIAPVKNVIITDVISPKLDFSTLKIIEFYHPNLAITTEHSIVYALNNTLVFTFKNINLNGLNQAGVRPESTKGYLVFEIEVETSSLSVNHGPLPLSLCKPIDSILNTAEIIFDGNPPIVTNRVQTNIYATANSDCLGVNSNPPVFSAVPNPIVNKELVILACNLPLFFEQNASYSIVNIPDGLLNNCNLNTVFEQEDSNACQKIRFTPECLSSGIHELMINYFGTVYTVKFLVP